MTVKKLSPKLRVYSTSSTCKMSRTICLATLGNVAPIYGTKYSTTKSVVNNNSIYETKTISGDLMSEKKTNNNKKRFDLKVLARRVYYTSAPSGPCKRHKGCMLRTANNEYSSLSRQFNVCAAGVVRVLI